VAGRLRPCHKQQRKQAAEPSNEVAALFFSALIAASQSALAFEFAQGVIVDGARSLVYVMNPEGGIDAVALSGGAVIATTTRGAKPLLLYGDALLAQAEGKDESNILSLVSLRTKDLEPAFTVDAPLPSGIQAPVNDRLGVSFYASARMDADVIIVQWRSMQRTISAVPTSEPGHVSTGFARIDPRNGRLIASGDGEPSTPGSAEREILGSSSTPRCASDDLVAAIQYDGDEASLRRWNKAGEPLPDVRLFDGGLTFRNFSRDCRHFLASKEADGGRWQVYSVASGQRLTELQSSLPGAEFFVWGNSLIVDAPAVKKLISRQLTMVQPHRLQAIDFTGKELWARPIRETRYQGRYPGNPPNPVRGQGK
jgi:hypothetical protein